MATKVLLDKKRRASPNLRHPATRTEMPLWCWRSVRYTRCLCISGSIPLCCCSSECTFSNIPHLLTADSDRQDIECCKYTPEQRHPNCLSIDVPHDDPFYKFFNRKCLDFSRILAGLRPSCTLGKSCLSAFPEKLALACVLMISKF